MRFEKFSLHLVLFHIRRRWMGTGYSANELYTSMVPRLIAWRTMVPLVSCIFILFKPPFHSVCEWKICIFG